MSLIRKAYAYILLVCVYTLTYLLALLGSIIPRRSWTATGRIIVTGRFDNPNWYLSHITPLSHSGVKEVIVISDTPQSPIERVRFISPPQWVSRLVSRAGAKAIWTFIAGFRYRPDLYMGYHLLPAGCVSLVIGRLLGRPSCYQMTGGPVEFVGGGYAAVDSFEGALGCPSGLIEALALRVVRQFELVVVRGNAAKAFLEAHGVKESPAIITGSTNVTLPLLRNDRNIHLIFVGRLSRIKQVHQFVAIVDSVRHIVPDVRAAIVGSGPLMEDLQNYANRLGLADNIKFFGKRDDVEAILMRSKVFVMTSKSEGLSIAMAEAMSVGTVPVVADVGELRDLVIDGVTGYLVQPNRIDVYTDRTIALLQDPALWRKCSVEATEAARRHCDVAVVSKKWEQSLRNVISRASGLDHQEEKH